METSISYSTVYYPFEATRYIILIYSAMNPELPTTYTCDCGLVVPTQNRALHEIRCSSRRQRPSVSAINSAPSTGNVSNSRTRASDGLRPVSSPGGGASGLVRGNDSGRTSSSSTASAGSLWSCGQCTLVNENSSSHCAACGSSRPFEQTSSRPLPRDHPRHWSCPQCTLLNEEENSECSACEFRREADERYVDTLLPFMRVNSSGGRLRPPIIVRSGVGGSAGDTDRVETSEGWSCQSCGIFNPLSSALRCGLCGRLASARNSIDSERSIFDSNMMSGLLFGALGGAALSRISGRSITSGMINGAVIGGLGGAALDQVPRELQSMEGLLLHARMLQEHNRGLFGVLDIDNMSYEELYSTFGGPTQTPTSPERLASLPVRCYAASDPKADCSICMESFKPREEMRTLPCLHFFHKNCIDRWLKQSKQCPICKHEV